MKESSRVSEARQPIFAYFRLRVKPRALLRHDEVRNLARAVGTAAGHRGDRRSAGDLGSGVRNEGFRAVDDPFAVAQFGASLHVAGIAAGARLGKAETPQPFAAGERHQVLLLLRFAPEKVERSGAERDVRGHRDRRRRVGARDFHNGERVADRVGSCSAILFRETAIP